MSALKKLAAKHRAEKLKLVRSALVKTGWNATRAGVILGASRTTVATIILTDKILTKDYRKHGTGIGRPKVGT